MSIESLNYIKSFDKWVKRHVRKHEKQHERKHERDQTQTKPVTLRHYWQDNSAMLKLLTHNGRQKDMKEDTRSGAALNEQ